MFALIVVILCVLVFIGSLIVLAHLSNNKNMLSSRHTVELVMGISGLLALIVFIVGSVIVVPTQQIAIMTRFQKVTGEVFENGIHFKLIIDTPVTMSLKTQLFSDDTTSASKDLQDVTATIAINYHLDESQAPSTYRTIGKDYINVIGNPIVQETVKEITAKYNAEEMITNREQVKSDISGALISRLQARGVICESVNITNFKFSDTFTAAIEAKVAAAQAIQTEQNTLLTVQVKAQEAAAAAQGQANATIAIATGQAEANKILGDSLTPSILQYMYIQAIKGNDKIVIPQGSFITIPSP
jgi:prohibitin 2